MTHSINYFEQFSQLNVLIAGDVMIDRYLNGKVSRISPEAPVPVVRLQERVNRLGGAANVALNIKALGATPYLCSIIGEDESSGAFLELLPRQDLPMEGVVQSPERITTVKTRVIAGNQHLLRVDEEVTEDLSPKAAGLYLESIKNILETRDIHVIIFQDYNKGVLSSLVIGEIIREALDRNIPTAVDPKFRNFWAYKRVTLFKPNLKEIRAQMPMPVHAEYDSLKQATHHIRAKLNNTFSMITLSDKGLFIDNSGASLLVPTHPRSIADVCGAGDTVISIAALGLAINMELKDMALLANLAGGQVCERVGVVPVNKTQLQQEFFDLKGEG